jgi:DNA polymerase-4
MMEQLDRIASTRRRLKKQNLAGKKLVTLKIKYSDLLNKPAVKPYLILSLARTDSRVVKELLYQERMKDSVRFVGSFSKQFEYRTVCCGWLEIYSNGESRVFNNG